LCSSGTIFNHTQNTRRRDAYGGHQHEQSEGQAYPDMADGKRRADRRASHR
jgi:hypothetical protein